MTQYRFVDFHSKLDYHCVVRSHACPFSSYPLTLNSALRPCRYLERISILSNLFVIEIIQVLSILLFRICNNIILYDGEYLETYLRTKDILPSGLMLFLDLTFGILLLGHDFPVFTFRIH